MGDTKLTILFSIGRLLGSARIEPCESLRFCTIMKPGSFSHSVIKREDMMASDTSGRLSDVSEFRPWFKHYDPEVPLHLTYPHVPLYRLLDETAAKHPDGP